MRELKMFIYWVLHIFNCPERDIVEEYNGSRLRCMKCNRTWFNWR